MRKGGFDFTAYEFVYGKNDDGFGNSSFGLEHPRGLDLRPEIPETTGDLLGIDLTHTIHSDDVAYAKGGPGAGGGGGGGTGTSFPNYTSGAAGAYNITIEFKGTGWTQVHHDIFVAAADRLSNFIIGDLPNVSVRSRGTVTQIDDILISAELGPIDGLYGVLGQAGPTAIRTTGSLPATATMKFDIVDVNDMGTEAFSSVVLHEMAHSLGFGSIWDRLGLVSNGQYLGSQANAEFHEMGGIGNIPIEQDGGSGTAGSHWDEETFGNELLTGYLNDGANYFTDMSQASFADLGYVLRADYANYADVGYVFA
jgi:hypothetical protein